MSKVGAIYVRNRRASLADSFTESIYINQRTFHNFPILKPNISKLLKCLFCNFKRFVLFIKSVQLLNRNKKK